ncbi:unannotated protein [freshwater metagenome]|uniref:Unannotated protein n=1 Tax=freshwater metagenome TaxID=449393 RepID=A0A6J7Q1G9_9ZZZZ
MPSATDRAIHDRALWNLNKVIDDLPCHYRAVLELLAYQPLAPVVVLGFVPWSINSPPDD